MASLIVVGLGNPGSRYDSTRHNLGFRVLDRLAERSGLDFRSAGQSGQVSWTAETVVRSRPVVLAKPRTYMNRSGHAVSVLCEQYRVSPAELLVVYDDADLEFGRVRVRAHGGAGGHNGMKSLIEALGTDRFPRIRLGVRGEARDRHDLADYVLSAFEPAEEVQAEALVALGADAVEVAIEQGLEAAMTAYNSRSALDEAQERPTEGEAGPDG